MTLKDDIEAVRDMVAKLEGQGLWSDRSAAERMIALAERAANPALQALLDACEAVPLVFSPVYDQVVIGSSQDVGRALRALARTIDHWRAAKAEGFVPAVERSGGPTSPAAESDDDALTQDLPAGDTVESLRVLYERETRVKDNTILDVRNRAHAALERAESAERRLKRWTELQALLVDDLPAALRRLAEYADQEARSREPEIDSRPEPEPESESGTRLPPLPRGA